MRQDGRPIRRALLVLAAALVLGLTLSVVVIAATDHWSKPPASALPSGSPEAKRLIGRQWLLVGFTSVGQQAASAPVAPRQLTSTFDGAGHWFYEDQCNSASVVARIDRRAVILGDVTSTAVGCGDGGAILNRAERELAETTVTWNVTANTLTLTKQGVGTFDFSVR